MSFENSLICWEFSSVNAGDVSAFSKVGVGVNGCTVSEHRADNGPAAFVSDCSVAFCSQSLEYILQSDVMDNFNCGKLLSTRISYNWRKL